MNITEQQIRKIASKELDIKDVFPEVFKFTGWAKDNRDGRENWLGYFENNFLQYGISTYGNWFNTNGGSKYNLNTDRPATNEEVQTALVNEAKKRGFEFERYHLIDKNDSLYGWDGDGLELILILENGTWAEVKKEPKYVLMNEGLYVNLVQVYRQEVYISSDSNKELAIIFDTKEKAEAMNVLLDNKYKLEEI